MARARNQSRASMFGLREGRRNEFPPRASGAHGPSSATDAQGDSGSIPVGPPGVDVRALRALDLFCGAGGWTTGATQAGLEVVACVNHWPVAVATHTANHPGAMHVCQDAGLVDPRDMPAHDVLLASPACQGHSVARGTDKPHHDASRATAWCVVDFAETCRPRWIFVENVPTFARWPLYRHWRAALSELGYRIAEHIIDAADCGVPQERRRLFVICERDAKHAPTLSLKSRRRIPASSFLDVERGPWSPIEGHAPRTLARIERAQREHGPDVLVPYYGSGSGLTGRPLTRPIGTITTLDRYALVRGDRMRMLSVDEMRAAMGFPSGYVLTGTRRERVMQLGNAVCPPVARAIVGAQFGTREVVAA